MIFFWHPDPDQRLLQWIRIRPNDTDPDPKHLSLIKKMPTAFIVYNKKSDKYQPIQQQQQQHNYLLQMQKVACLLSARRQGWASVLNSTTRPITITAQAWLYSNILSPVFRIRFILMRIQIRFRNNGSGSGTGSGSDLNRTNSNFFLLILFL